MALPLISDIQFYIHSNTTEKDRHDISHTYLDNMISQNLQMSLSHHGFPFHVTRVFAEWFGIQEVHSNTEYVEKGKKKSFSMCLPMITVNQQNVFNQKFWNLPIKFCTVVPLEGPHSDPSRQSQNPSGLSHLQISAAGSAHCRPPPGGVCPEHIQSLGRAD